MQKLQKYQPKIAVFNGKCEVLIYEFQHFDSTPSCVVTDGCFIFDSIGIYDIFSKEVFGVKVKKLEFGLQPHKVPDTETVSSCLH